MKTIFWGLMIIHLSRRREKDIEEKEKKEVVPVTIDISRGPIVSNCQITWKCLRLMRQVGNLSN